MFLVKPFRIISHLDKMGMYGDIDEMDGKKTLDNKKKNIIEGGDWWIHPWLSFYKYDFIKDYEMNWLPAPGCDTGGSNWEAFIKKKKLKKKDYWYRENIIMYYPFAPMSNSGDPPYKKHYDIHNGEKFYGQIQVNNEFMHLLNSSILNDIKHPKTAYMKGLLDAILLLGGITFDQTNFYEIFDSERNKW